MIHDQVFVDALFEQYFYLFPIVFVAMWLAVTTVLDVLCGWYLLMRRYPDQDEIALLKLKHVSGWMGVGVGMHNVLTISVCQSGLRFGIMRIFGPFCRNFFVPWESLYVSRKDGLLGKRVKLTFGNPELGKMCVPAYTADRLARAALGKWPEEDSFSAKPRQKIVSSLIMQWALMTFLMAMFFIFVPQLLTPQPVQGIPIGVAILFPAIVNGVGCLILYFRRSKS